MALTKVSTPAIKDEAITLAKLLHGDSNSNGKFLRANNGADPSFETVTSTTINSNADNRVITGSGSANTLNGESGLTYNGSVLTVTGNVVPVANNTHDLGTSSVRWRDIFTNDLNLSNEGSSNDIDGTWGNYTIQEGAEDLFLINRRNGKKFKFVLKEVS